MGGCEDQLVKFVLNCKVPSLYERNAALFTNKHFQPAQSYTCKRTLLALVSSFL